MLVASSYSAVSNIELMILHASALSAYVKSVVARSDDSSSQMLVASSYSAVSNIELMILHASALSVVTREHEALVVERSLLEREARGSMPCISGVIMLR
uniref:Uncharacterized protein n=1 Tax=Peronospora matthiolae TaxID=2874970 RepID=A0AAV1TXW3_9STRA